MNVDQFSRLNSLSEKLLHNTATQDESEEFFNLFAQWQNSDELNLFSEFYRQDINS
jgi:hypothetical protein